MNAVLFNLHDVVLIITVIACFVACACLWRRGGEHWLYNSILALFSIATLSIPIDTLVNYGEAVRPWVIANLPDIFFLFEFGAWIQAPLAYWLIRSMLQKNFRFEPIDYVFVAPCLLQISHQAIAYHSLPTELKIVIQKTIDIDTAPLSVIFFQWARDILRCYLAWRLHVLILNYLRGFGNEKTPLPLSSYSWLYYFGVGFFVYNAWTLLISSMLFLSSKVTITLPIASLGLAQNYVTALFWLGFITLYARSSIKVEDITPAEVFTADTRLKPAINPNHVSALTALMEVEKVYIDPDLKLQNLAERMGVSPRTLSTVINGHFGCTFFEYVNGYRLQEAKQLLLSPEGQKRPVLDIMYEVGFNSKATFNALFKKAVGLTPTQFRRRFS
jgi:AraC-like DNA-binding protein